MWLTWRAATQRALYGDGGFYLRERPDRHFRTSVHVSAVFAWAVLRLVERVDGSLGRPEVIDLVDVGSGDGLLPARVLAIAPPGLAERLRITAVDLAPRPPGLDGRITWADAVPDRVEGLIVANEWLDNIPVDVVEHTPSGPRLVLVDPETGAERLGPPPCPEDLAWLDRWWPLRGADTPRRGAHEPVRGADRPPRGEGLVGRRAEIGRPRDEAWAAVIVRLARGTAIAVDYAHRAGDRPPLGSLTAYRDGSVTPAVPDGSCDITAHVALDACAAAGELAGAVATTLTTQREALRDLGVTGVRPPVELAAADPVGYVRALGRAAEEAELIDPAGLGGFGWLAQVKR
ncbi:SAM-dependent methyltransferase [Sphaerimonospora sp. CA-214678]|uniref:SAM-dependent methyltransferase n=1 Tax=Sphaerimonospora sp. CA-214678 TaxID=3240029 RepID=UPI003D8BA0C5